MNEIEFAAYLRSQRKQSAEEVAAHEREHDLLRGLYVPHVGRHHTPGESRH